MRERIKEIMDNESLTPTKFADKLQVNRAVISHIINGRNNPSLDVVMSILAEMPYINSDWLLNNKGPMYKEGFSYPHTQSLSAEDIESRELFSNPSISSERASDSVIEEGVDVRNILAASAVSKERLVAKKISQIIIYYEDNTFETFKINK